MTKVFINRTGLWKTVPDLTVNPGPPPTTTWDGTYHNELICQLPLTTRQLIKDSRLYKTNKNTSAQMDYTEKTVNR